MAIDARLVGQMTIGENEMAAMDLGGSIVNEEMPSEEELVEPEFEDEERELNVVASENDDEEQEPDIVVSKNDDDLEEEQNEEAPREERTEPSTNPDEETEECGNPDATFELDRRSIELLAESARKIESLVREVELQNEALTRLYQKEVERNDRLSALYKKTREQSEHMRKTVELTKQEKEDLVQAIVEGAVEPVHSIAENVYDSSQAAVEAAVKEIEQAGVQARNQLEQLTQGAMERNQKLLQSTAPKKTLIWAKSVGIGVLVVFGLAYLITFVQGMF